MSVSNNKKKINKAISQQYVNMAMKYIRTLRNIKTLGKEVKERQDEILRKCV